MTESPDWFTLVMGLTGGLAIFLIGMDRTVSGLKGIAGNRLRWILSHLTGNRWFGAATGAGITAIIQSSSITTVVVVGLVSAKAMTLTQSVGVIFGANVGTTITAQIIAFKVTKYALAAVAIGFAIEFFSRSELAERIGRTVLGLGLVFFGMAVMGLAMEPLTEYQPFLDAMAAISNVWIGVLIGAVFTALIQSSSATTAIVIAMAATNLISLELAIAFVLGANVGTSVTAQLAAIGKPVEAKRVAMVHTLFNVIGVVIWIPFVPFLASVAIRLSPAGDVARQVAWAHTTFNVANLFIFIWFTTWFAKAATFLVKDRKAADTPVIEARYLSVELLATPSIALDRARMEIARMGTRVRDMVIAGVPAAVSGTETDLAAVEASDDEVDELHAQVVAYLGRISERDITREQTNELLGLLEAAGDMEAIGDAVEINLVSDGRRRLEAGLMISPSTAAVINDIATEVITAVDIAVGAVGRSSPEAARRAIDMKPEITARTTHAIEYQLERLTADEPDRVEAYRIESDIIEDLKRIYYYAKRAARVGVPDEQPTESPE
ncbi:MAG: Na/Pi cotransporter family protein [Actinomycetota bacterium]|nr:Na/Pi cotransporter family protein [Actinomycetota bacterium]